MSFQHNNKDDALRNTPPPARMQSESAPKFTPQAKNYPSVPSTGVEGNMDTVPSSANAILFGLQTGGASAATASQDNLRSGG